MEIVAQITDKPGPPTQAKSEQETKEKAQAALQYLRRNEAMDIAVLLGLVPEEEPTKENPE